MRRREFVIYGLASGAGLLASRPAVAANAALPRPGNPLFHWQAGRLRLLIARSEIGQGVITALALMVADELDLPVTAIDVDHARYDPDWPHQGTSASLSVYDGHGRYRSAAASLRRWLLEAAAARWAADVASLDTQGGEVRAADGRRLPYDTLIADAAAGGDVPLPAAVPRRRRAPDHTTPPTRLEGRAKVDGTAVFGADIRLPGMQFAAWWAAPAGERVAAVDDAAARALNGVGTVIALDDGVAVLARDPWTAGHAVARLQPVTRRDNLAPRDSDEIDRALRTALEGPLPTLRSVGDPGAATAARDPVQAQYEVGMLAHVALEPGVATAAVDADGVRLWLSTQHPERARQAVARALGRPAQQVQITKTLVGGGFGRKTYPDLAVRAARVAQRAGVPVQLSLSREADFDTDFFRPPSLHRLTGRLDAQGRIADWRHDASAGSVMAWYGNDPPDDIETDPLSLSGVDFDTYQLPRFLARGRALRTATRAGIWRSIGHFSSALANECFIDELAAAASADPVDFRLRHLAHAPRTRAVLERVATAAGWRGRRDGDARLGVALFREFHPKGADMPADYEVIVAHVARLEPSAQGWRLTRLHVAIDCGQVLHPGHVAAQMEGGAAWALSALSQAITVEGGRPTARNLHAYAPARLPAMPAVQISIVASDAWPAGVGEKGVPGVVPALLNAWFAVAGERVRRLPWVDNPLGL